MDCVKCVFDDYFLDITYSIRIDSFLPFVFYLLIIDLNSIVTMKSRVNLNLKLSFISKSLKNKYDNNIFPQPIWYFFLIKADAYEQG